MVENDNSLLKRAQIQFPKHIIKTGEKKKSTFLQNVVYNALFSLHFSPIVACKYKKCPVNSTGALTWMCLLLIFRSPAFFFMYIVCLRWLKDNNFIYTCLSIFDKEI